MSEGTYKILIVDDDDIVRETYVQIFKQKNAEVISAKDGVEGLDFATKDIPDVIMTGIIMPRMDGFQLIKALRENVQTANIPIVILSHLGREEDRKKAEEMGITNFIVQGTMTPNEIVGKVKSLTDAGSSFKLSFDPYAWDAPRLGKLIGNENFSCPSCNEKMILEISEKKEGQGFDGKLRCPKCDYSR
ncbi:MAG: response regulator [Parcubacteria group bacterium]|jgi:CheY-like chemotaxis protein